MTTVTQWIERAPEDVRARFEFFDGRWQEKPMAGALHQDHVFLITAELKRRGLRAVFDLVTHLPEVDPDRGKRVELRPDVLVVSRDNPDALGAGEYYGVPDLVVEVVSTLSDEGYDAGKRPVSERNGVRHDWLVRLTEMTVEPFRLTGGRYVASPRIALLPLEALPVPPDLT
jgi:Uma2 family endonuclease